MKTLSNLSASLLCGMLTAMTCVSCVAVDAEEEESAGMNEEAYEWGSAAPADRTILTELDAYYAQHGNASNYPICVYPEAGGLAISNVGGVVNHMSVVINKWLIHLYNRWGWDVSSVSFQLKSTTESGCAASYDGYKPLRVTSHNEGAYFGGMPIAIKIRCPGNTINVLSDGKSERQTLLHEMGHVLNLGHTMGQSPVSVMDYDDVDNMNGLGGDDVIAALHSWKYMSGQVAKSACEFGYANVGGWSCVPSGGDLLGKTIKNVASNQCIQAGGTGENVTFVMATCNGGVDQQFEATRNTNGSWRLVSYKTGRCVKVAGDKDGAVLKQVSCNQSSRDQNFSLSRNAAGTFKMMSEYSGNRVVASGSGLSQEKPSGKAKEDWYIQ